MPTYKTHEATKQVIYKTNPARAENHINVHTNTGGGSTGTKDYNELINKPSIESVTLIGNKDFPDLGLTNIDIDDLLEILV